MNFRLQSDYHKYFGEDRQHFASTSLGYEVSTARSRAINDENRGSFGYQGNMVDGQTPNMLLRKGNMNTFYNENISTLYQLPNHNLKWEVTRQVNMALELSFWDGRLNISGEDYYKKTTGVFADIDVSPVNGVLTYKINNGDLSNRGFFVQLFGDPVRTKDFKWHMSTCYSVNKNNVDT